MAPRADSVDHGRAPPVRLAQAEVVRDHARLAQREPGEHAEGVQRDQRRDVALEDDDQHAGDEGEEEHAVREHEPVAPVGELPRHEAVAGDDRRQPGEVGVGGVGGQDRIGKVAIWSARTGRPCRRRRTRPSARARWVVLAAVRLQVRGEDRDAEEAGAEDAAHDGDRRRGVLALRLAERRDAVRHGLDAGQRDGAGRERP